MVKHRSSLRVRLDRAVVVVRESSFNMTRGGMKILAVQFFRTPALLLVLKYTNFRSPPLIFSEPTFRVSKSFGSPPPTLVILNELSLSDLFKTGDGI